MPSNKKILNSAQIKILSAVSKTELKDFFYWGGGTVLAYKYLGHRLSSDLDFFSDDLIDEFIIQKAIKAVVEETGAKKVEYSKKLNQRNFNIFFDAKNFVKLQFVFYPFPAIGKRTYLKDFKGVKTDSLEDIATNKVFTVFDRFEPKDIYDLYIILKKKRWDLGGLFKNAEKKFGMDLDQITWVEQALRSIESIKEIKPLFFFKEEGLEKNMQKFFLDYSRKRINVKSFK